METHQQRFTRSEAMLWKKADNHREMKRKRVNGSGKKHKITKHGVNNERHKPG